MQSKSYKINRIKYSACHLQDKRTEELKEHTPFQDDHSSITVRKISNLPEEVSVHSEPKTTRD